jgi:capsular exopolysaccharide synthesis family protein
MHGDDPQERERAPAESESEFDLRGIIGVFRRHRLAILLVTLPLLIPATVYPFLLPHYYEATATIELEKRAPVLEFGRDVLSDGGPNRQPSAVEASIVTLATSDTVLGSVLDQLPDNSLRKGSLVDSVKRFVGLAGDTTPSVEQERKLRLETLRDSLRVGLAGGGAYLAVTATARTAASAAFLANAVSDAYLRHVSERREAASQRAVAWLNQQIYELRDQTARKEQAAAELISQGLNPRAFVDTEKTEGSAANQLETQIQTTRIELLAASQRLVELSSETGAEGAERDPNAISARNRSEEQYQKESANLEAARLKFTPTHPEVRRLEAIVESLGARVSSDASKYTGPRSAAELAEYQALSREKGRLESKLRVLERSRGEQLAASTKLDAYSRYRRLESELEIDREMLSVVLTRRNETMLSAAKKEVGAQILDAAVAPLYPAGPLRRKLLAIGWMAAIAAGLGMAYLIELLDRRLRDPEKIALLLGTQSLCVLPVLRSAAAVPERQGGLGAGSLGGEGYRSLRTALVFAMRARKIHTLLVSSAIAGEGKTTTSANLAAVFARMGKRVILVDADMRRPRLHRVFRVARAPGLSGALNRTVRALDAIVRPEGEAFDFLPAGELPDNPTELLSSNEWTDLLADLQQEFDLVLIDSPVLLAVPDSLLLAANVDGVILVHKPGSLERRALNRLRADLKNAGARVLGIVFNQVDSADRDIYPSYLRSPYVDDYEDRKRAPWKTRWRADG